LEYTNLSHLIGFAQVAAAYVLPKAKVMEGRFERGDGHDEVT
jgi:hypothetical protein